MTANKEEIVPISSQQSSLLECCMCGDSGLTQELFQCKVCQFRSQHRCKFISPLKFSLFFLLGFCFRWSRISFSFLNFTSVFFVGRDDQDHHGFLADTVAICIQKLSLIKFVIGVWIKRRIQRKSLRILLILQHHVKTTTKMVRTRKRVITMELA